MFNQNQDNFDQSSQRVWALLQVVAKLRPVNSVQAI